MQGGNLLSGNFLKLCKVCIDFYYREKIFSVKKMIAITTYPHSHWWVCCTYVEALVKHKCNTHPDLRNDEEATAAAQLEASA
jgi:hypothetical protein